MFLLHNHWLAVHKVGWNACVTDGLRGKEGRKNRLSSLPLVGINTLFAGIEMGIKGEGGQKMRVWKAKCRPRDVLFACARVMYKVYVRQDNYDRAALPSSFPGGEGSSTLFNRATRISQVDKPKDDLFACESLV